MGRESNWSDSSELRMDSAPVFTGVTRRNDGITSIVVGLGNFINCLPSTVRGKQEKFKGTFKWLNSSRKNLRG